MRKLYSIIVLVASMLGVCAQRINIERPKDLPSATAWADSDYIIIDRGPEGVQKLQLGQIRSQMSSGTFAPGLYSGASSPNGFQTGNPGQYYLLDDGTNLELWTKRSGFGTKTGWVISRDALQLSRPINVKSSPYRAQGDGVTDDTAAIQAALNDAGQGGVVELPFGNYLLSGPLSLTNTVRVVGTGYASGYNAWPGGPRLFWTAGSIGICMTNRSSMLQNIWLDGRGILSNVVEMANEKHELISCQVLGATGAGVHIGAYANHNRIWDTDINHCYNGVVLDGYSSTQSYIEDSRIQYNTNAGIIASSYIGLVIGPGTKIEENRGPGIFLVKRDGLYMDEIHFFDGWNEVNWGGNLVTTNLSTNVTANVGTITIGPNVRWTEGGMTNYPGITNGYSKISSTYNFKADREVWGGPFWVDTNVTALTFVDCPYIGDVWGNTNAVRFLNFDNPGSDRLISGGLRGAEKFSVTTNGLIRAGDALWISSIAPTNLLGTAIKLAVNAGQTWIDDSGNAGFKGTIFPNQVHATNSITSDGSVNGAGGIIGSASIQTKRLGVNASPLGNLDVYGNDWGYIRPYTTNTDAASSPDPSVNGHGFGWNRSQGRGESVHSFSRDVGTAPALEIGSSSTNGYLSHWLFKSSGALQNNNGTASIDSAGNAFVTTFKSAGAAPNTYATWNAQTQLVAGGSINRKGYIVLRQPDAVDGTGCTIDNSGTYFNGHAHYAHDLAASGNWAWWFLPVPDDLDTNVDLTLEHLTFATGNTDTGTQRYVVSMAAMAPSSPTGPGTFANAVNADFAGDPSGAAFDVEYIDGVTLTGWKSALTPGRGFRVRIARDGSASQDSSTVYSVLESAVISYQLKQ